MRLVGALPLPSRGQVQNTKVHFNPLPKIPMTHHAPPAEKLLTRQACRRPPDTDRQLPVAEVRRFQALDGLRVERDHVAFDPVSYTHLDVYKRQVSAGRMTQKHASGLLPAPVNASGAFIAGLLTGKVVEMPKDPEFKRRISGLLAQLKGKDAA